MKFEIGMYVRYVIYGIEEVGRIIGFEEDRIITEVWCISKGDIIKASHNVLDVIEHGDFVNMVMVYERKSGIRYCDDDLIIQPHHVKSIVTNQQFESMMFKVKESG